MDIIKEIDARVRERSILKHPFYVSWKMGELSNAQLREYSRQYYKHVEAFPQYLSMIHSQMGSGEDRKMVLQNLIDEEQGANNHPELWVRFAEALGVKRSKMDCTETKETKRFVKNFKDLSASSVAEGIAALYTYESQIPKVSEEKIRGLVKFYGVKGARGLEYFKTHMAADIEHSAAERRILRKLAKGANRAKVLRAVDKTLDAYWNMLTGIQNLAS
jgi:pyrroloquinoline-quinone synthase